eukprot:2431861-Karenia_brevis.AAC.1
MMVDIVLARNEAMASCTSTRLDLVTESSESDDSADSGDSEDEDEDERAGSNDQFFVRRDGVAAAHFFLIRS